MLVHPDNGEPVDFYHFEDSQLSEEAMKIVRQDISETAENRTKSLTILKNMLAETRDLHACTDDDFLLRFLRVAKFDCSRAYDRMQRYYGLRKKFPHIFRRYLPSQTRTAQQLRLFYASPLRTRNQSCVVINYHGQFDPSTASMDEKFSLDMMAAEVALDNPLNQMCGANVILDFKTFNLWKMLALTPHVVRMYVEFLQNSFPLRLKSIIFVNTPAIFSIIFNLFYPVLSKKLRSRLLIHSTNDSWESLHAILPPAVLPEEYGGHLAKSQLINMCDNIENHEERFRRQQKFGVIKAKHRDGRN